LCTRGLRHDLGAFIDVRRRVDHHPRPATPASSAACGTYLPGLSPHSRGVGKIFPGLKRISGSNAQRSRFMVARSSSENISLMYAALSAPTPCSPVIEPPVFTQTLRISPAI